MANGFQSNIQRKNAKMKKNNRLREIVTSGKTTRETLKMLRAFRKDLKKTINNKLKGSK